MVRRREVSAEDVEQVLRLHADRVHDAARRLGVGTDAAVDVVRRSALALVSAVAEHPEQVPDAAGWWFAEARRLSRGAAPDTADVPLGGGLLAVDADQLVLAETLEDLDEDQRLALLLRDAYRLPWSSVAAGLQTGEDAAATTVFRARTAAVPLLDDEPSPPLPDHADDVGGLARLGEGGAVAPRDATLRRHVQACSVCAAVVASQERVHLLMSGLAVDALPSGARHTVLAESDAAARAALPPAASLVLTDEEWEDWEYSERRVLSPLLAVLGVIGSVLLGSVLGVVLSRGASAVLPMSSDVLPAPSLAPVQAPSPFSLPTNLPPAPPIPTPRTRVFTLAPRTTAPAPPPPTIAPASTSPTPTPSPSAAPSLAVNPTSGKAGDALTVTGAHWTAGGRVTVDYLDASGRPTGSGAAAVVAADGSFTATLTARDSSPLPGRRTVRATDGTATAAGAFDQTL